jgi:uncharacterized protein YigA (DUF484 family)
MTTHAKAGQVKAEKAVAGKTPRAGAIDDDAVARFLVAEPAFFERHPTLLAALRLPHQRGGGSTVSLVERQVDVLREHSRESELRLRTLIENGHANDALADKIHRLALRLIRARDPQARLAAVEASLREDFAAPEFVVVLTHGTAPAGIPDSRSLRHVPTDDPGLRSFDSLFASGRPRCGRVRDSQREFLFPAIDVAVGSVALVPLLPHLATAPVGLLAIASPDANHFNPSMSTDFLARIGELVATALDGFTTRGA